jgi:hypothetical protein
MDYVSILHVSVMSTGLVKIVVSTLESYVMANYYRIGRWWIVNVNHKLLVVIIVRLLSVIMTVIIKELVFLMDSVNVIKIT